MGRYEDWLANHPALQPQQPEQSERQQPTQADNGRGRFSQTRQSYLENAEQKKEQQRAIETIRPQLNFPQYETVEQTRAALKGFEEKNRGLVNDPLSEVLYDSDVKKYTDQINFLSKFESGELGADFFGRGLDENSLAGQMQKDKAAREQQRAQSQYEAEVSQRISDGLSTEGAMNEKFGRTAPTEQQEQPEEEQSAVDRFMSLISGIGKGNAAAATGGQRLLYELGQGARSQMNEEAYAQAKADYDRALQAYEEELAAWGEQGAQSAYYVLQDAKRKLDAFGTVVEDEVQQKATQAASTLSQELNRQSGEDIAKAKEGLGTVGRIAVDTGAALGDILIDAASGMGALNMAGRVFGRSAIEAEAAGANTAQQLAYGTATAAFATGLNKVIDGLAGVYGKGFGDDAAEAFIAKIASTDKGRNVARAILNIGGEGAEEFTEGAVEPLLKLIYDGGDAIKAVYSSPEAWSEALLDNLYSAAIGSVIGAGGQAVDVARGGYRAKNAATPLQPSDYTAPKTGLKPTSPQSAQPESSYTTPTATSYIDTVAEILSSGRVNNTQATAIATDPTFSRAFYELTGIRLDGMTTEDARKAVQDEARSRAYNAQQSEQLARQAAAEAEIEQANMDMQASVKAAEDAAMSAVRNSNYDSYIRGVLIGGTDVNGARQIARNKELRSTWERFAVKTLPENEKSAVKMIMQTRRKSVKLDGVNPEYGTTAPVIENSTQGAQESTGGTQIPPSTQTANAGQTERLNQQEANSILDELVSHNRNTDENSFNVRNGNGKETVSNEPVQQPSNVDLLLEATGNVAKKPKENADTVLQEETKNDKLSDSDPKLERAIELSKSGEKASEVYNQTGYMLMANGNIVDPETGKTVWEAENGENRGNSRYSTENEEIRTAISGVPANDGRGAGSARSETVGRKAKPELSKEKREQLYSDIESIVSENYTEDFDAYMFEYGDANLFYQRIIDDYNESPQALESWAALFGEDGIEAVKAAVDKAYSTDTKDDLGQNVRSFEAPTKGELKFASGKRVPVSDEQKDDARALNASDLKGHNVRVAEPPKADDNKAATVKNNFGSRSAQAKNAADKIAGRFTEKKDKNGNVISNSGTVLADRVRAVADGDSDLSNFRDYYSRLKDSPKSETRSLYHKEVAEKLDEANANLYGEDGNRERGHKLAADALSLLSKRIEQRDAADAVIAKTKGKISELTKKFKETSFYKNKIGKEKGIKLTAGLLTPRNYLKMIDGFSADAGGEGYKLAKKETEANKKEKELIVEAKNLFNGFLGTKDAEKFLNGYFKSGVKLGDHELSMIELTHLVREWESALESREGGIGGIAFKAKGKPVSYGKDAKLIVADERGVKTELSLGDEGAITRLRKTLDFLSDKNEVLSEYNKALDKVFEYMLPKLKEAHMNTEGYDMGEILDGKYFPVAYMPKGGAADTEGESFFSLFRNVKDRTRQDGGILLIDPTDGVIDRYIQNSAQYAAWADFSRQMQMLSEKGAGGTSLMDVVEENLGADVAKTLKEYADALKFESSFNEKNGIEKAAGFLRKNLGQAALTLKLTTPLKQAAGTVAAAGDIKLSYLLRAQFGGGRKYKNAAGENKLYQHRTLGNIDSTVGNVANISDTAWKKAIAKIPFVGEKWLTSISRADQNAIKNIYYAAAMQVSAENGNADITKSDALMEQVDELFADALLNTQSDATKISASSIYRSDNELTKNVTLFKSQQNAQLNATIAAALEAHAAKGTASESKAKDKYARAVAGQIVSSAEFAILGAIADAVLHKHGKYQDDEDEFTFESIASELGDNAAETLFGIHLFGDTLYSVMAAAAQAATGKEPDSIFNPSLGGINTVVDITSKLNSVLKSPSAKNIKNFAVSMSNASGVPLSGFYDVISGASLWIKDIVSSIEGKKISISSERDILNELLFDIDKKKAVTGKGIVERTADAISGDKISEQRKAAYRVIDELVESTGKLSLTPANFEGKIEHNSKEYTLNRKERQKYSDTAMDTYYSLVDELVEEASFKNAGVELKEAIVLEAKKYAIDAARAEYFENADIEYTSEFKNINEGIVKRGKDDDGNPKPDIPAIPKKDIAEYLAYKTAFSAAEKAENYTALDALLEDYKKLPNASRQQFKQGNHSSLIDAYEAGVSSKSYNKYTETLKKQAEKHDLGEDNSVAKLYGVSNAKISSNEKNALAELVLSKNTKTVYQAAVKHDYPTADIPELYEKINADGDGYIEQAELYSIYKANPAMEALLEEIWNSNGWKTSLQKYKSKQR